MPDLADLDLTLAVKVSSPELRRLQDSLAQIGATGSRGLAGIESGARGAGRELDGMGKSAHFVARVFEGYLLYRGFTFLKNQVVEFTRELVELEHQLGLVRTQLDGIGGQGEMRQRIVDIGRQTGVVFSDLAKAEFQVVSANIALADSYEILGLSAKAAVTGGLADIDIAFNAALSQVNAFGLANSQFGEVFDKQFQLVKRGIFSYSQFATVVGTISESFAAMGQDIDTANAALAAISQVFTGRQLERGATALRNMVIRFGEAREDFEALGVAIVDSEGAFRNIIDIGRDLEGVLAGMSESARFSVLRGLFPDERELRGAQTFLGVLDQAEQFYVEQKFASGALAEGFDKVNDSLRTQANIFRNDLIPIGEGFTDGMREFLAVNNALNDPDSGIPGLTRSLIAMAVAMGAVGAASAFGPGLMGRAGIAGLGSTSFLTGGGRSLLMGGVSTPSLRLGRLAMLGAGAGVLGAGLGGNQQDPFSAALFGAAGGAGIGAIGGPWAALGGAIIGGISGALRSSSKDFGDEAGKTMAESFADALEKTGSLEAAFSAALGLGGGRGANLDAIRRAAFSGGIIAGRESNEETARRLGGGTGAGRFFSRLGVEAVQGMGAAREFFGLPRGSFNINAQTAVRAADVGEAARDLATNLATFDKTAAGFAGLFTDAELRDLRHGEAQRLLDVQLSLEGLADSALEEQQARRSLVQLLVDSGVEQGHYAAALEKLNGPDGLIGFLAFLRGLTTTTGSRTFASFQAEFGGGFGGPFGEAAEVFRRIGVEGERLADSFEQLQRVSDAFSLAQSIFGITVNGASPFGAGFQSEVGRLLLESALGTPLAGLASITPEQFVQALFPPDLVEQQVVPGATALADSLFTASDLVREGLIDGLGFTADGLEMMGEELEAFNRLLAQRRILEEIQGIADFAGVDIDLKPVMQELLENVRMAGGNFIEMLSDPKRLAELLSELEFGDVQIDQSDRRSYVIRISGGSDLDVGRASEFADAILAQINEKTRRKVGQ